MFNWPRINLSQFAVKPAGRCYCRTIAFQTASDPCKRWAAQTPKMADFRILKTKIEFPPKVQASTYGKQRAAQNQRFAGARGRADCGRTRLCLRRPPPASRSSWFPRRPSLVARYRSSSPRFPIADAALTLSLSLLFKNIARRQGCRPS